MRVLFVTGEFPPLQGGVGDCTNEIAKELTALGAEVQILTRSAGGPAAAMHESRACPPFPVATPVRRWDWSSLGVIARVVREFIPDILHIQYQTAAFGMHPGINLAPRYLHLLAPRFGRVPRLSVATTFHDLRVPYLFPKAGPLRGWITRELARSSDSVIATNPEDYGSLCPLSLRRLTLIPIGSNIPCQPPIGYDRTLWREQLGIREDETLLCYFGFLNESKGGETLVRALAELPRSRLLMIGGKTGASDDTNVAYLAHVEELISQLGLADRVLWTDYTTPDRVTANFLASDLCVLPYRDGASYRRGTLMAALAHAMPIVTTQGRPPVGEGAVSLPPLEDGENCLLVPPKDPLALARAVERAAHSPDLCARLRVGARELAQHFTWDKIARDHLALYDRILSHAPSDGPR